MISIVYGLAVLSWCVVLILQWNGAIARAKGCNVGIFTCLGDGRCDGGMYNTEVCEWDGGDCDEFNKKYPDCIVPFPTSIGDRRCSIKGNHNTKECGWDGLDCFQSAFPNCAVDNQDWSGDGDCDGHYYFSFPIKQLFGISFCFVSFPAITCK